MLDSDTTLLIMIAGAVALAVLCAPVALVLIVAQRGRIGSLEARLARLEGRAPATVPVPPAPAPVPAAPPPAAPAPQRPPEPARTPSPVPAVAPAAARPVRPSVEERFGTRWTVWAGGLALALGAALLVRYSVEQGLFGPGARIALGLVLAAALVAGGEALRRRLRGAGEPPRLWPDIPATVTAAGTVAAFGTVYAAYALYGFLGPAPALVLLGAVGFAAMFAALLHGQALAGLGLLGAMGAPLLVGGNGGGIWPLALYLPVVAGFAYAFAWTRGWRRLADMAGIGAAGWSLLLGLAAAKGEVAAALLHVVLQAGLAALPHAVLPGQRLPDEASTPRLRPALALALAAGTGGLVLAMLVRDGADAAWIMAALAHVAIPAAAAFRTPVAALGLPVAVAAIAGILAIWPQPRIGLGDPADLMREADGPVALAGFALAASLGIAAAGALRLLGGSRLPTPAALAYAVGAALGPLAALALVYLRLAHGEVAPGFAAAMTGLAALFRRQSDDTPSPALTLGLGAFASAAVAALALGLVFGLAGGSLTLSMALAALGTAAIARRLDIPALRWCVAGLGIVVAARLAWDPSVVGADLSRTPILNGLLLGYGVPALAFGLAARLIRLPGRAPDAPLLVAQALSVALAFLLVFFEIRHALHGGDILAPTTGTLEQGLVTLSSLGFALVLVRLDGSHGSVVLRIASLLFGALAMLQGLLGLGLFENPLLTDAPIAGGVLVNDLLPAYGLPALAALWLAATARATRPAWYVRAATALGGVLGLLFVSLGVRHAFQGERIGLDRATGDLEWFAHSAAWLGLGLALLAYGVLRGSRTARIASAGLVGLATLKVFLFDLAGLEGPLRALSFLGLGAALIGIGLVYQRLVFAPGRPAGVS